MTMNPLPPQAYTKDTLLKAYHWLQHQMPSIKEMALTPDILVSLYLKSTRDGEHSLERPSVQNFKNELKSLAGMMGELDRAPAIESTAPPVPQPLGAASLSQNMSAPSVPHHPAPAAPVTSKAPPALLASLDPLSLEMIREVKELLNLSSEAEALRAMIKMGHSKAHTLLK